MVERNNPDGGPLRLGLDVGSTTAKAAVLDAEGGIVCSRYRRHYADLRGTVETLLSELYEAFGDCPVLAAVSGSGGIKLAEELGLPFVQEVIAGNRAVKKYIPDARNVLELGGEDAKLTFLDNGPDQRMNGICAGGTGAFIDQMALLLKTDPVGLDRLAEKARTVYPIAARCGVFAKTDIQSLLNEGARREDIAASILQAVVNQTIGGLACGRKIQGKTVFLGGPLHYLPQLRMRFRETLRLERGEAVLPEGALVYVAAGAALSLAAGGAPAGARGVDTLLRLRERCAGIGVRSDGSSARLAPLFQNPAEYAAFLERHAKHKVRRRDLASYEGRCFLGLDIGSTTCKSALIDEQANLLYSYYAGNDGSPLGSAAAMLRSIYDKLPKGAEIAYSAVTGYGENLVKAAFSCDMGEVETVAHFEAANFLLPGVDTILDIGGQDMKYMKVRDGVIENVLLNEACSSGCGSFIETFARTLGLRVQDFAEASIGSASPVDLGSRCTVFMNSRVKQAQKDGCALRDISAGLCYSVVKNALFKVIKMRDAAELGGRIVVQGGTFRNDAILRCFELTAGKEVVRPDIPELMGAFGAALLAKRAWREGVRSALISPEALRHFSCASDFTSCRRCENRCRLTVNRFNDGRRYITGNRCERGAGSGQGETMPNMYEYKYGRLFRYVPLEPDRAPRGAIGLPRVLNMYENYPFWFTFFTELGFRVVLSPPSSRSIYELGMDTISSDTACYPVRLVNGHIAALLRQGVKHIFYPCLPKERAEFPSADNHYNCPMVACYPEVIRANIDLIKERGAKLHCPFLPYHNKRRLKQRLLEELADFGLSPEEVARAVEAAWKEDLQCKADIREKGEEIVARLRRMGKKGIVLSGRPYHLDPEVHHGIPELIASLGLAVLTEDSVSHLGKAERPLRVFDQWMYHTRLYEAADFVSKEDCLELVQLDSFGCGPDSIAAEQAQEILSRRHKLYTLIKIDEVSNLGAARIRLRSLLAAMAAREPEPIRAKEAWHKPRLENASLRRYAIIGPQMAPIHFELMEEAIRSEGYRFDILPSVREEDIEEGLKYVNNDSCYPAIIVIGQILNALKSGKYDPDNTAILMPQTGGPCRASNYISLLHAALRKNGFEKTPVVSLTLAKGEPNRFPLTPQLIKKAVMAMVYGDLLMQLIYQVRPYELIPGSADSLLTLWLDRCKKSVRRGGRDAFRKNLIAIAGDFNRLEVRKERKIRVGLVGEILVKYHPAANNHMAEFLERANAEMVVPNLTDFFLYCALGREFNHRYMDGGNLQRLLGNLFIRTIESYRDDMRKALRLTGRFKAPDTIYAMAEKVKSILSLGNHSGEGWLLTAEIVDLIENGVHSIVCMQPFACLPNHISGRGMLKALKEKYPQANITAIDYDPGASQVNQLNRIRLLLDSGTCP